MDQTTSPSTYDRRRAVERLADFVAQSVEAARAVEKPFYPSRIRPRVSRRRLRANFGAEAGGDRLPADARPQQRPRSDRRHPYAGEDRSVPGIHPQPAGAKRALWDVVGRALCADKVRQAFIRRLAPGLSKRFGADFAKVGMYPIPILTRDIPGYLITPHTDTRWKGITVQLYLPADDANTDIGTIFHEKSCRRLACPKQRKCGSRRTPAMPSRSARTPGIPPIRCMTA